MKITYHPQHHLEEQQCILRTVVQPHGAKFSNKFKIY